jgi:hypothetical protein
MLLMRIRIKHLWRSFTLLPGKKKKAFIAGGIALFFIILLTSVCHIKKEPEKVWNVREKIAVLTKSLIGLPYQYGGYELDGFDCSGLVYYVYDCYGIKLPRTAKKQAKLKEKISLKRAKPGDILAFKLKRRWHTAIYIGDKSFVHAPNQREKVRKETINAFWKKRLKRVIRIIED